MTILPEEKFYRFTKNKTLTVNEPNISKHKPEKEMFAMQKNDCKKRTLIHKLAIIWFGFLLLFALLLSAGCKQFEHPSEDVPFEAFGTITEYSTYAKGEMLTDSFYYSDAWFGENPENRNDHLALMSMQLSAAAIEKDENGHGAKALRTLGFERVGFAGFETEDPDDCAYTWATKKLGDYTLVAIVIQSYALDAPTKTKGWKQNLRVNGEFASGEHAAFKKAAEKVLDGIAALGGRKAKYWIMGQSRAGALANLIAAKLPDKLGTSNKGVFAYTFESPATVDAAIAQSSSEKYSYIHNYITSDDIVTLIPMWGMVRYGKDYELKSEDTELALSEELTKIGSGAADVYVGSYEEKIRELVEYLEARVSAGAESAETGSREDYSRFRRDVFEDNNGNPMTIEYSYQEIMEHVMGMIFSGELNGLSIDLLEENLSEFASFVCFFFFAVKGEPDGDAATVTAYYMQAAQGLRNIINGLMPSGSVSLNDTDFYALLRLIGPKAVDVNYEREGDDRLDVIGYIYPVIDLAESFSKLNYSHYFDVVIARLKTLAPQPSAQSFEVSVAAPKEGDSATMLADAFTAQIEDSGQAWLSVKNAEWNIGEQTLQSGSLYYFNAELNVVGHLVPESFRILINGKAPVEVSCKYDKGAYIVRITWEFAIGTPDIVSLSFETGNGATAPASFSVEKGKMLKYAEKPAFLKSFSENGKTVLFDNWKDESGMQWEEITATEDMRFFAKWIQIIDDVRISFTMAVGESIKTPTVPEGAVYIITEYHVSDEDYNFIEEVTGAGTYYVSISVFDETINEYDEKDYSGKITVNGEEHGDYSYDCYEKPVILAVYITYTVE